MAGSRIKAPSGFPVGVFCIRKIQALNYDLQKNCLAFLPTPTGEKTVESLPHGLFRSESHVPLGPLVTLTSSAKLW